MKRKFNLSLRGRSTVSGLLFISPWLIGMAVFFLYSVIRAFSFSFNDVGMEGGFSTSWVGLDNFRFILFEHGTYNRILFDSVTRIFLHLPLIIFFSLFMAILLNRAFAGRALVRAIFFLPVILASAAIQEPTQMVVGLMLGGVTSLPPEIIREQTGFNAQVVANMLLEFGVPTQIIDFIIDSIAQLHDVIRASGVQILIFLAALQAIPSSMYEVAQIEGATSYEIFWKITIPMVSPLILTNIVYTIVDSYVQSSVVSSAHITAFTFLEFGRSSAMSVISSSVVLLLMGILVWLVSKRVFYYN